MSDVQNDEQLSPPMGAFDRELAFRAFVGSDGARLRRVLFAHFGPELGREAMADALAYAWEHWDRVGAMSNPVGFLYRVGQSSMRRQFRWRRPVIGMRVAAVAAEDPDVQLPDALSRLPATQRTAVVLVHCLDWTLADAASTMNVSVSTLRNHLRRGLERLRTDLGGTDD